MGRMLRGYTLCMNETRVDPHAGEHAIGGHSHLHGRPGSWVLVGVVIAAFFAGGLAIIARAWWLFWVCAGIVALSVPTGKVIGIMDDTVGEAARPGDGRPVASDHGSAADPGVRI
jgi:hypothetical protein